MTVEARVVAEISPRLVTSWGNWGVWEMCPADTYAGGFRVRFEGRQGTVKPRLF